MRERVERDRAVRRSERGGGEGEWTLVSPRFRKSNENSRIREDKEWYERESMRRLKGAGKGTIGRQQNGKELGVVSYYFTNFPSSVGVEEL